MLYQLVTSCPSLQLKLAATGIVLASAIYTRDCFEKRSQRMELKDAQKYRDSLIKKDSDFVRLRIEYAKFQNDK